LTIDVTTHATHTAGSVVKRLLQGNSLLTAIEGIASEQLFGGQFDVVGRGF